MWMSCESAFGERRVVEQNEKNSSKKVLCGISETISFELFWPRECNMGWKCFWVEHLDTLVQHVANCSQPAIVASKPFQPPGQLCGTIKACKRMRLIASTSVIWRSAWKAFTILSIRPGLIILQKKVLSKSIINRICGDSRQTRLYIKIIYLRHFFHIMYIILVLLTPLLTFQMETQTGLFGTILHLMFTLYVYFFWK